MLELLIFIVPVALGFFIGRINEKKHYRSIKLRERLHANILLVNSKQLNPEDRKSQVMLVCGQTVIAIDAFKKLSSGLSNFFGGRVTAYETIIDRARRESILRMQEHARKLKAYKVINIKVETSTIGQQHGDKGTGAAEVLAYGTALIRPS